MLKVPVLAILSGKKKTGKTMVAETLTSKLVKSGLKVAAAKHIAESRFTLDAPGTDTHRLAEAGAQQVVAVTSDEVVNILKTDTSGLNLEALIESFKPTDLIVLEGFKSLVLQREDVVKIIVSDDAAEVFNLLNTARRPIAAITGEVAVGDNSTLEETGIPLVRFPEETARLTKLVFEHYQAQRALIETRVSLGGLNCGDCGYETCYEHAKAILAVRSSLDKCMVIRAGEEVTVTINGVKLPMKGFVQDIIKRAVLGMVSSLQKTDIHGDERLNITITRPTVQASPNE